MRGRPASCGTIGAGQLGADLGGHMQEVIRFLRRNVGELAQPVVLVLTRNA
jgi:hypothetical protein